MQEHATLLILFNYSQITTPSQKLRWEKLKRAIKSKLLTEFVLFEKYNNIETRKGRRIKRFSLVDATNGIHPCLIKRPSIILPEDIAEVNNKKQPTKSRGNSAEKKLELSDSEGRRLQVKF